MSFPKINHIKIGITSKKGVSAVVGSNTEYTPRDGAKASERSLLLGSSGQGRHAFFVWSNLSGSAVEGDD